MFVHSVQPCPVVHSGCGVHYCALLALAQASPRALQSCRTAQSSFKVLTYDRNSIAEDSVRSGALHGKAGPWRRHCFHSSCCSAAAPSQLSSCWWNATVVTRTVLVATRPGECLPGLLGDALLLATAVAQLTPAGCTAGMPLLWPLLVGLHGKACPLAANGTPARLALVCCCHRSCCICSGGGTSTTEGLFAPPAPPAAAAAAAVMRQPGEVAGSGRW